MLDGPDSTAIKVVSRISEIPADSWNACVGGAAPFLRHGFLDALEASGSAVKETGWLPRHLVLEATDGRILGAAPLYLKNHSYGEYVFDWGWANAYERAGGDYYPKLQCCVPFTPVTGPRLLIHPECDRDSTRDALIQGLIEVANRHRVASLHVTFPRRGEWRALGKAGFLRRKGLQYHWENRDYASFDDFLASLASRKRKAVKKERREAQASGLTIRALTGDEIEPRHWDAFHRFYISTSDRKWGQAYLTREFFDLLGAAVGDAVVLILAEHDGIPVAAALNLRSETTLYGRNWGAVGYVKFLHFELCYYQAIDYAIAHGLERVEAGAQGEHKIQRGYLPVETYSAHLILDPGLERAVDEFLDHERRMVGHEIEALGSHSPFRKSD